MLHSTIICFSFNVVPPVFQKRSDFYKEFSRSDFSSDELNITRQHSTVTCRERPPWYPTVIFASSSSPPSASSSLYESIATVGEIRVHWRGDFQSGSRVLKKVFWTFSYLYLWHTMWFHAKKLLKTLKFWKLLNSLANRIWVLMTSETTKKAPKTTHSIAISSKF